MIVKNEQNYLPFALGSIYKHLDELIILDTGSTDKTLEIASGFCEHVPQSIILQMPWKQDFSLARNVSQGGAKSSHIIWLDGDEVLTNDGARRVKQELITDNSCDFWLMPRVNFWKDLRYQFCYPDNQYKIYRNNNIRWRNKIHEQIYSDMYANRLKETDIHLYHYAYVKSLEEVAQKMAHYIKIENPDMDEKEVLTCSTQHSYFKETMQLTEGVTPYRRGIYPEVFDEIEVSKKFVKHKLTGETLVRFKGSNFVVPISIKEEPKKVEKIEKPAFEPTPMPVSVPEHISMPISVLEHESEPKPMPDKTPLVSIVIATYNKIEYVKSCILSIYSTTYDVPFEIILVDNGSTENIESFIKLLSQSKDNITYLRFPENLGFSRGYNEGIKVAKGQFIMVLNNDTLFSENFLKNMLEVWHERDKYGDAGLIGPVSNNNPSENGKIVAPEGTDFNGYLRKLDKMISEDDHQKCVESAWMTAVCYLFHRDLLTDLANIKQPATNGVFFEERLPVYHNDTEINWRIHHRLKKKLWIAREAFLWHYGQVTVNDITQSQFEKMKTDSITTLKMLWPEIAGNIKF